MSMGYLFAPSVHVIEEFPKGLHGVLQDGLAADFAADFVTKARKSSPVTHIRVVTIGDSSVGKSCLVKRGVDDTYDGNELSTIGADYCEKTYEIFEKHVNLRIFDTSGQERFRSIGESYYRGAQAVLVCFDLTNRASFENARMWVTAAYDNSNCGAAVFLIGCKSDLIDTRTVSTEEAEDLAIELEAEYCETSAKEGWNVSHLFRRVAYLTFRHDVMLDDNFDFGGSRGEAATGIDGSFMINLEFGGSAQKGGCCGGGLSDPSRLL